MTSRSMLCRIGALCCVILIAACPAIATDYAAGAQEAPGNPFPQRIRVPDFPRDAEWLNTTGPVRKRDLKGKFVLLDFWTYCCINCMHILPELKKLEQAYPNQLVVIGVHSAKFETEKDARNIEEAILRYEIEHPVVNDADHEIWNMYGVRSWPTLLLIDPEGMACWGTSGEIEFETMDKVLKRALPYYRQQGLLDETPVRFDLLRHRQESTRLRFPGKVLADEANGRLFITDSNHNRIIITTLDGELQEVIGSGAIGREDGDYRQASFDHPQGLALRDSTLYVADTENHLLRKIDLASRKVTTIAGTGVQRRGSWPGLEGVQRAEDVPDRSVGRPKETALNSPWALWVHQDRLYIAMAGPHQIWVMPLDESEIGPYAGNGREDIVDGPLLPRIPYETGYASFAQPSGLTSDGTWLYVADSEGSSIRAVPFDTKKDVRTIVGTADLPHSRLFTFGDRDGTRDRALLQHPLGVAFADGTIYVADTYNNKIKAVDAATGKTRTVAGSGKPGFRDNPAQFDEPSGLAFAAGRLFVADTNNHAIRTVDLANGSVATLEIKGLTPPASPKTSESPATDDAETVQLPAARLAPADGKVTLNVRLELPAGWKINPAAPMRYQVSKAGEAGPFADLSADWLKVNPPKSSFSVPLTVRGSGDERLTIRTVYYYCQEGGEGLCKVGSVAWTIPVSVSDDAPQAAVTLTHSPPEP